MYKLLSFAFAATFAAACVPALAQTSGTSTAAMPACNAGDPVVWENTAGKHKTYHMQGDRYYGATKHGAYVCKTAADAAGYHAAGAMGGKHHSMAGTTGAPVAGAVASAAPAPLASGMTTHRHHRRHGLASPAPGGSEISSSPSP